MIGKTKQRDSKYKYCFQLLASTENGYDRAAYFLLLREHNSKTLFLFAKNVSTSTYRHTHTHTHTRRSLFVFQRNIQIKMNLQTELEMEAEEMAK